MSNFAFSLTHICGVYFYVLIKAYFWATRGSFFKNKGILFGVFLCCCVSRAGKPVLVFFRGCNKLASSKILCSGDCDWKKHERTFECITRSLQYICVFSVYRTLF